MPDTRPNFTLARCCRNCHYFTLVGRNHGGVCNLGKITNPKASPLETHATCTCDAHTWKKSKHIVQRPAITVGAKLPDDVL